MIEIRSTGDAQGAPLMRNETVVTLPTPSRNSPTFFFGNRGTISALETLSGASDLVLYCGAGVSIDQTSVTWTQLVKGVFRIAKATLGDDHRLKETKSVEYLLAHLGDDRQAASILVEEFRDTNESENIFLGTKLKDVLYRKRGWQRGYIMRNLVQLSLAAARHGRNVTIITTNYDVYIEDEFVERRNKLIAAGLPADEAGGLSRRVLDGSADSRVVEVVAAGSKATTVEIIYLHGRVDHVGGVEGDIVLTEQSYARSRERSSQILRDNFSGDKGVLIVGASLTDEPLIHALALTKSKNQKRFILLKAPEQLSEPLKELKSHDTATVIDAVSVGSAWQLRATHLGVKHLSPMSHSQSAQFLEELRVCLTAAELTKNVRHYGLPGSRIGYPQRLAIWHASWSKKKNVRNANLAHKKLHETLTVIQVLLKEYAASGETLRIELWARRDPSSTNRRLTLWANSTGPLLEESTMRTEAIDGATRNASVRALLEGRPLLTRLSDMRYPVNASRWQTFLSVPIFVQVPTAVKGAVDSAYIPVGVVTLASDKQLGSDVDPSVLSDSLPVDQFVALKQQLIAMGREVLRM